MKIRKYFVSNSSSSSYICEICGEEVSGYDIDLSDIEMFECENGHVFCEEHLKEEIKNIEVIKEYILNSNKNYLKDDKEKLKEMLKNNSGEDEIEDEFEDFGINADSRYELPSKFCPLCQLEYLTSETLIYYLLNRSNLSKDDIIKEIKQSFKNEKELKDKDKLKVHFRKLRLNELKSD